MWGKGLMAHKAESWRERFCSRETQALTKGKGLSVVHMVHSHISADTKAGQTDTGDESQKK